MPIRFSSPIGEPRDLVTARHCEGAYHRQNRERKGSRIRGLGLNMIRRNAGLNNHQRKFADLRQVDRRQQAGWQALFHQINRRECGVTTRLITVKAAIVIASPITNRLEFDGIASRATKTA